MIKWIKENYMDTCIFSAGVVSLIVGIVNPNIFCIILGIFLIYFSEVILEFFKLKKHQRDMKAVKKNIADLKKMSKEEKEEKKKEKKNKHIGSNYESTMDKWNREEREQKKWDKKHKILAPIRNALITLRRVLWYKLDEYPNDIKFYIRRTYQRAVRGWAVSDAWGFSWYLSKVIIEGCEWLKKNKHGVPMSAFKDIKATGKHGEHTDEEFKLACKNWKVILGKIIKTFKITQKLQDSHWYYQKSETYNNKEAARNRRINKKMRKGSSGLWKRNDLHVMTKKECQEYEEGWQLFQEHYFGLWD